MPFGLGATEILIILAVVTLLFGPKGVGKLVKGAQRANKLKRQLSPQAMLSQLVESPDDDAPKKKSNPKAKKKSAAEA